MHLSKNRVSDDVARHYAPPSPSADPWKKYRREPPFRASVSPSQNQRELERVMIGLLMMIGSWVLMLAVCFILIVLFKFMYYLW